MSRSGINITEEKFYSYMTKMRCEREIETEKDGQTDKQTNHMRYKQTHRQAANQDSVVVSCILP